ncbi:MAG: RNA polymerase sigma-70 factor [Gelidibacter sp.]
MDENTLIAQIKEGNALAFRQFFDSHYRPLCFYLLNFTHDKDDAEDMAQMVFLDFWNKREQIEIHSSLKSYLFKMAYHEFLMVLRKKNIEASILEQLKYEALQSIEIPTEEELEHKSRRLHKIIEQLPDRCRAVLKLKMEGLKYKDIADSLNLSIKTVESQMRIAFIKIRDNYKDDLVLFLLMME